MSTSVYLCLLCRVYLDNVYQCLPLSSVVAHHVPLLPILHYTLVSVVQMARTVGVVLCCTILYCVVQRACAVRMAYHLVVSFVITVYTESVLYCVVLGCIVLYRPCVQ